MTAKKLGGLGRGLGAIYDDFDVSGLSEEDGDDKRLETVKLDELRPGSTQPRSTMTEEGLQELADSIRQQGIISPIIVRPARRGSRHHPHGGSDPGTRHGAHREHAA